LRIVVAAAVEQVVPDSDVEAVKGVVLENAVVIFEPVAGAPAGAL
jgi:hypothetical protein